MERRREAERQKEAERQEAERQREAKRQREIEWQRQQEQARERVRTARRNTVKTCVSIVRQQSGGGYSRLDAYVTGEYGETYNYFGSANERFRFEKCMAERGIVLSTSTEKDRR